MVSGTKYNEVAKGHFWYSGNALSLDLGANHIIVFNSVNAH